MKRMLAWALLLVGCGRAPDEDGRVQAGSGLERAALARGLIVASDDPVGLYASDTDRVCIVARAGSDFRFAATVDYGPDHRCSAAGTAYRDSGALRIRLSDTCNFTAQLDGDRIVFPAVLPGDCDRACTGRASLAALEADRLSASPGEAATMSDRDGRSLCAS